MIRSLYTINRNMNILQKKQENTSANLANINTPGYKFQDIVQRTLNTETLVNYNGGRKLEERQELGPFVFGNQIDGFYRNFDQGNLYETNKGTDFAIVGNGFFTVQMDNGQVAYTRNGNFRVNEEGQLTTMEGHRVLGSNGYIYVVDEDVNMEELLITDFNNYEDLNNIGDTLFTGNGGYPINGELRKGYLEASNVNMADAIVKMIEISREFESNQKLLHAADETLNKAVNEIGRV